MPKFHGLRQSNFDLDKIELLVAGNSGPDQMSTSGILNGWKKAREIVISKSYVEALKESPFYIRTGEGSDDATAR